MSGTRMTALGMFGLFLAVGVLIAAAAREDAKKDLDKMQGTWLLVSGERDGTKFTDEEIKQTRLIIRGETFSIPKSSVGTSQEGTFTIDPSKKPKQMDSTQGGGPDKGKTWLGIYEVDDSTQKVCFSPPGKDRPKEFSSKPGSGQLLQVWKRAKK